MSDSQIASRAFEFGRRIVKLCDVWVKRGLGGRHIATQLIKCGTLIGANAEEAEEAQTKADFIAKLCISRKEARESIYWLKLGVASNVGTSAETVWELDEARQLLAMIRSAVLTARTGLDRKP